MTSETGLLGRAQLRREASQARLEADKLRVLHNIGAAVAATLETEGVLTRVVEAAGFITNAEEASLLLLDNQSEELYLRAQKGLGERYARGFRIKTEDSIAGEVVRTGRPQRLASADSDLKVVTGYMVKSIIYVPVTIRGAVIGVLSVDNKVADRSFTEEDEDMLSVLAGYAAIALDKARLVEELDRRDQVLADLYGIGQVEPDQRVDLETVGIVLYLTPELCPPNGLNPRYLATVVNPYLSTLADIQHLVDEIEGRPPSNIRVLAITQDLPAIASMDGVRKTVDTLKETVAPSRQELARSVARLQVKEKDAAIERAEAEALEARSRAVEEQAEREQLLAEAARHYAAVEGFQWEIERLRRELQDQKIDLALDFVARVKPDLPNRKTIAYAVRLLPALEQILSSPLQVVTVQERP